MRHRHAHSSIVSLLMLAALALSGCASIAAGNDPVVVNAERSTELSLSAFDAVTQFDHQNLELMKSKAPAVHEQVQQLRREFPAVYRQARDAVATYKALRSKDSADNMSLSLDKVEALARQAREALVKAQTATR